jgi:hypothetical protein
MKSAPAAAPHFLRQRPWTLSYFIEKPFQSWTRTSAAITGSVLLWVDYSFRVEEGRKALKEITENSPLWDRRCEIREKFMNFIQRQHPESLPKLRAELAGPAAGRLPEQIADQVPDQ